MHSISSEHLNINSIIDTLQHSVYLNICSQREIEVNHHGHQQPATNNILHATIDTIHASTICLRLVYTHSVPSKFSRDWSRVLARRSGGSRDQGHVVLAPRPTLCSRPMAIHRLILLWWVAIEWATQAKDDKTCTRDERQEITCILTTGSFRTVVWWLQEQTWLPSDRWLFSTKDGGILRKFWLICPYGGKSCSSRRWLWVAVQCSSKTTDTSLAFQ